MKSRNAHYEILDYSICNDHILYPSINYEVKTKLPKQNIGIFIIEVNDWEDSREIIIELFRYSLIDSFSVQISIATTIRTFLVIKIICLGANELNYRYTNLKKHLKKKSTLTLMQDNQLEASYLSLLDSIERSVIKDSTIYRENQCYYMLNLERIKKYFLLVNLDVFWISQNHLKVISLIELLHAANIKCFLIFFSKNLGDTSQSNYYLFSFHPNYTYHLNEIKEKLLQCRYPVNISNVFHPEYLGRLLTRGPIATKFIQNTTLPPILNMNLGKFPQSKSSRKHEIKSIQNILQNYPCSYDSKGYYEVFDGKLIIFQVNKLNISSIRNISQNLNGHHEQCIIFFENPKDYDIFNKKMGKNPKTKKTIAICDLNALEKVLQKFKTRKRGVEISSY